MCYYFILWGKLERAAADKRTHTRHHPPPTTTKPPYLERRAHVGGLVLRHGDDLHVRVLGPARLEAPLEEDRAEALGGVHPVGGMCVWGDVRSSQ